MIARLAEDEVAWRDQIGAEVLAGPGLTRAALEAMMKDIVNRWVAERRCWPPLSNAPSMTLIHYRRGIDAALPARPLAPTA